MKIFRFNIDKININIYLKYFRISPNSPYMKNLWYFMSKYKFSMFAKHAWNKNAFHLHVCVDVCVTWNLNFKIKFIQGYVFSYRKGRICIIILSYDVIFSAWIRERNLVLPVFILYAHCLKIVLVNMHEGRFRRFSVYSWILF